MADPLEPQQALETATMLLLRSGLGYTPAECDRSFDGRPSGRGAKLFVGVWSDGARSSGSRVALDERFGVNVTITVQLIKPMDRWHEERDRLERELNRVRAAVHLDTWSHYVKRKANELAGLGSEPARHVGFTEALYLLGVDAWQEKGGEWFAGSGNRAGIAQTCRFGGARLIQSVPTAR